MDAKEYVKNFKKITVNKICKEKNFNKGNVASGRANDDVYKTIKEEIENKIAKLYIKEEK